MRHSWFYRMIWSYIPLFMVLFLMFFFVFFQVLINLHKTNTGEANLVYVEQVSQTIELTLKTINNSILTDILNDELLRDFYADSGLDNVPLQYRVLKKLNTLKQNMPFIDSIYLVRHKDSIVYNGSMVASLAKFEDYPYVSSVMSSGPESKWSGVRTYRYFSIQAPKKVITLSLKAPTYTGELGLIVVNVSLDTLQKYVNALTQSNRVFVTIYDKNRNAIIGPGATELPIISSVTSDYTGWTYESGLANAGLSKVMSAFSAVWLLLGLGIFASGIVSIIYITKRNVKPLQQIISQTRRFAFKEDMAPTAASHAHKNEFAFLESTINRFILKAEKYEKQNEENRMLQKKQVFHALAKGSAEAGFDEFMKEWEALGPHIGVTILVIEIDHFTEFNKKYSERDRILYTYIVNQVFAELTKQYKLIENSDWIADHRLCSILFHTEERIDVQQLGEVFIHWVNHHLPFTVTIGVSRMIHQTDSLVQAYQCAENGLSFKPVMGSNRLIPYSSIEQAVFRQQEVTRPVQLIHQVVDAYRFQEENWACLYDQLFVDFRENSLSRDNLTIMIHYFIYDMDLHLSQLSSDYYDSWKTHYLSQLLGLSHSFETLEELHTNIKAILLDYAQKVRHLREQRTSRAMMEKVKQFIDQQYCNPGLSLESIGEAFQINAKYVSQLFRDEFGVNFLDYLMGLRINKAVQILMESSADDSLRDIGERVGYVDPSTFRRVFKRITGMSPAEYRKGLVK